MLNISKHINNPEHYHNKILINDRHKLIDQLIVLMDDKPGLISGHKALVRNFQNHVFRCISPSFF